MSDKYLNNTGLAYFWSKIKAWAIAVFAPVVHNQASNTITAMTGYSKPSSTSAIAAGDTLNQAIGKLEKAIDDADISNVVHKTGDEDIQGFKTFKPSLVSSDSSVSYVNIRNPSYDRAVTSSGTYWTGIKFGDASGDLYDTFEGCSGLVEHAVNAATKNTFVQIACYKSVDTSSDINYFRVGFTTAGLPYILFNCDIINDISLRNSYEPAISFHADNYKKGDSLSAETQIAALYFHDNANPAIVSDRLGGLVCRVTADKTTYVRMLAYKDEVNSVNVRGLSINYEIDGTTYGACPTHPDMSKNDETIATAYWVRHATGNTSLNAATASDLASGSVLAIAKGGTGSSTKNFVDLSNDQSVSGNKTFNSDIYTGTLGRLSVSGNLLKRVDSDALTLCGGSGAAVANGAYMVMRGTTASGDEKGWVYIRTGRVSNSYGTLLAKPNGTLTWNGSPVQVSSDERLKTSLSNVPDDILDGWEDVKWGQFKFLSSIAEKRENARYHVGLIAQSVDRVFSEKDMDICRYGILCHETKDEVKAKYSDGGELLAEHEDALDLWMVRYTEALCMEAAYQRRENARLKKRVADLEERLAALELKVS